MGQQGAMSSEARISGVVLAAGGASRMGRPKQLLPLGGEPLLRQTIRVALRSRLSEVIVVLGYRADEIGAAVGELGQRMVVNTEYRAGQSASLAAGVEAVARDADGMLVLLGDQPEVRTTVIDALIHAAQGSDAAIIVPGYDDTIGHPVLFRRQLFDELRGMTGDVGARDVVRRPGAERLVVPVAGEVAPRDVDTPEAYERLVVRWEAAHPANVP